MNSDNITPGLDLSRPIDLENLPASIRNAMPSDPARDWDGAPPFFGQDLVPHIYTSSGYVGSSARAYPIEDECTRSSPENSERMRTEPAIRECIEARQRAVAGLKWHLQPEDEKNPREKKLCDEMTKILKRTPWFFDMRMWLMEAIWLGKAAVFNNYCSKKVGDNRYICVKSWEPRHGDKLVFRYDDGTPDYQKGQMGIRIHATWAVSNRVAAPAGLGKKIEATQYGLVRWFDDDERRTITLHKHMTEDSPYNDPRSLGRITGVGIRDRIYHCWLAMTYIEQDLLTFISRAALGVRMWRYPSGNPEWKKRVEEAAKNAMQNGYADILFPVEPNEFAAMYGCEQLEPGLGGAQFLSNLIQEFYLRRIKRYILGQTSSSESAASGLGSGISELHMATLADLVQADAIKLSETITTDFLHPLIEMNFPDMAGSWLTFNLSTEHADAQRQLQMLQAAWSMGVDLCTEDLYSIMGTKKPTSMDQIIRNPSIELGNQQVELGRQQLAIAQQQQQMQASGQQQEQPQSSGLPEAEAAQAQQEQGGQDQGSEQPQLSQEQMPDSLAATHKTVGPTVDAMDASQMPQPNPQTESTNPQSKPQPPDVILEDVNRLLTPRWLSELKEQIMQLVA
jgi:hypothetical protein